MNQQLSGGTAPAAIEVPIVYLVNTGVTPVFYQSDVPTDNTRLEGTREQRVMTVKNARLLPDNFSLDVEGFAFASRPTAVTDFWDDAQLKSIYEGEVRELVAAQTGASEVVVFDHTRRSSDQAQREKHMARDPAGAAHSDYTDFSAEQRMRDVFPPDEAEARLKRRFGVVNTWRSMTGTIAEWPLALCDARTINSDLMHTVERRANHRTEPSFEYTRASETQHPSFDANHRWYYYPQMQRDEVILIKNYDTLHDGTARYALHTAFEDPNTPKNAPPRESIESRVFVFYDD